MQFTGTFEHPSYYIEQCKCSVKHKEKNIEELVPHAIGRLMQK